MIWTLTTPTPIINSNKVGNYYVCIILLHKILNHNTVLVICEIVGFYYIN